MTLMIVVDRDGHAHSIDPKPGAKLMEILRELSRHRAHYSSMRRLLNHKSCLPMHHRQPGNGAPHVRDRRGAQPTQVHCL
jgi:hypothetical protein